MGERREENREGKKAANSIVMPYSREHLLRALDTGAVGYSASWMVGHGFSTWVGMRKIRKLHGKRKTGL